MQLSAKSFKPEVYCIRGPPDDEAEQCFGSWASAQSVSTYPVKKNGIRDGDPIADQVMRLVMSLTRQYVVSQSRDRVIIALADGCGWGWFLLPTDIHPFREAIKRSSSKSSGRFSCLHDRLPF